MSVQERSPEHTSYLEAFVSVLRSVLICGCIVWSIYLIGQHPLILIRPEVHETLRVLPSPGCGCGHAPIILPPQAVMPELRPYLESVPQLIPAPEQLPKITSPEPLPKGIVPKRLLEPNPLPETSVLKSGAKKPKCLEKK